MPPIRPQFSKSSTEQEGRILLAIEVFQNKKIPNIYLAARTFNMPRSTRRRRLSGI